MVEPNCVLCGSIRDTTTTSTVASTRTMWLPWRPHVSRTFWAWCPPSWGAGCRPSSSSRRKWEKNTSSAWRKPSVSHPQPQESRVWLHCIWFGVMTSVHVTYPFPQVQMVQVSIIKHQSSYSLLRSNMDYIKYFKYSMFGCYWLHVLMHTTTERVKFCFSSIFYRCKARFVRCFYFHFEFSWRRTILL